MQKTLKRFVLLIALVLSVVCCVAFAACDNGGGDESNKATYAVTVTLDDGIELDLTQVSAQWKDGADVKETKALDADGKASVKLEEGNYTVVLTGSVLDDYDVYPSSKDVSASNPDAQFSIKEKVPTHNIDATITAGSGVVLPLNINVEIVDDGGIVVSSGTFGANGKVSLKVPEGDYTARLANLPETMVATPATLPVTTETETLEFTVNLKQVEYTVTVTASDELNVDDLTVTFYSANQPVEGATELQITGGSVTKELPAGNYTVKIDNIPEGYKSTVAELTYANPTGSIAITANYYIFTLHTNAPVNISDYTQYSAQLKGSAGLVGSAVAFDSNGVAKIRASEGDYEVVITGETTGYAFIVGEYNADNEATIEVYATPEEGNTSLVDGSEHVKPDPDAEPGNPTPSKPYGLSELGQYYVEVEARDAGWYCEYEILVFGFTAPEEGEKLYTISFIADTDIKLMDNGSGGLYGSEYLAKTEVNDVAISAAYLAEKDSVITFAVAFDFYSWDVTADSIGHYIIKIESSEPPEDGDALKPIIIENENIEDTHTGPDGKTDVYFRLDPSFDSEQIFTITFAAGTEVYYGINKVENVETPVESEGQIVIPSWSYVYLRVVAGTAPVSFTLEEYEVPAATPLSAIEIEKDVEASFTFIASQNAWFKFTPSTTGDYRIFGGENFTSVTVYGGYEYVDTTWFKGYEGTNQINDVALHLEESHTYYFVLAYTTEAGANTVKFTLKDYVALDGEKDKPIEVQDGENTATDISYEDTYFVYEATADGLFLFSFTNSDVIGYIYFYSDAQYSVALVNGGSAENYDHQFVGDSDYWMPNGSFLVVTRGQKIYFTINSYSFETIPFNIAIVASVEGDSEDISYTDSEVTELTIGNSAETAATLTVTGTVYEGDHIITITVSDTSFNGVIYVAVGANVIELNGENGVYTGIIYLSADDNEISIYTLIDAAPAATVSLELDSITLTLGEEGDGESIHVTLGTADAPLQFKLDGVEDEGKYVIVIKAEEGKKITISYGEDVDDGAFVWDFDYDEYWWFADLYTASIGVVSKDTKAIIWAEETLEVEISLYVYEFKLREFDLSDAKSASLEFEFEEGKSTSEMINFTAPEFGYYSIVITGDGIVAGDVNVNNGQEVIIDGDVKHDQLPEEGGDEAGAATVALAAADGAIEGTFYAERGEEFTLQFDNIKGGTISFTATLSLLPCGDFVLGETKIIQFESKNDPQYFEYTFKAPANAVYEMSCSGETGDFVVDKDGEQFIGPNAGTALYQPIRQFNAYKDAVITFKFNYVENLYKYGPFEVTITYVDELIETLAPGGSIRVKVVAGDTNATVNLEGLVEGVEYTLVADAATGVMSQLYDGRNFGIIYNGGANVLFSTISTDDELFKSGSYMAPYIAKFTAAKNGDDIVSTLEVVGGPNSGSLEFTLYLLEPEGLDDGSLKPGGSVNLEPDGIGSGRPVSAQAIIVSGLKEGTQYTITIATNSPGDSSKLNSFTVYYGEQQCDSDGFLTWVFTANSSDNEIRILSSMVPFNAFITVSLAEKA